MVGFIANVIDLICNMKRNSKTSYKKTWLITKKIYLAVMLANFLLFGVGYIKKIILNIATERFFPEVLWLVLHNPVKDSMVFYFFSVFLIFVSSYVSSTSYFCVLLCFDHRFSCGLTWTWTCGNNEKTTVPVAPLSVLIIGWNGF